jgi:hypothetical protein
LFAFLFLYTAANWVVTYFFNSVNRTPSTSGSYCSGEWRVGGERRVERRVESGGWRVEGGWSRGG